MNNKTNEEEGIHCPVRLRVGCHYWYRHKHKPKMVWRVCYIDIADGNAWLSPIGAPAMQLSEMNLDLGCFDWKLIPEPNAGIVGRWQRRWRKWRILWHGDSRAG